MKTSRLTIALLLTFVVGMGLPATLANAYWSANLKATGSPIAVGRHWQRPGDAQPVKMNLAEQECYSVARTYQGCSTQIPTFSFVTVTTTVSVPDGGPVLIGGIKRPSEDRNEFGVPILNKLPFINRLFKNVDGCQSLMMMVAPRIIIQEEEEERLGIDSP